MAPYAQTTVCRGPSTGIFAFRSRHAKGAQHADAPARVMIMCYSRTSAFSAMTSPSLRVQGGVQNIRNTGFVPD